MYHLWLFTIQFYVDSVPMVNIIVKHVTRSYDIIYDEQKRKQADHYLILAYLGISINIFFKFIMIRDIKFTNLFNMCQ